MAKKILKIEFKGEEVKAIQEILTDYIGIMKYSYTKGVAVAKQGEDMFKNEQDAEKSKQIAEELEALKKDMGHLDAAIGRAISLNIKTCNVLGIKVDDEGNLPEGVGEPQDGTAGDEQSAEVSEDA